jgi:hypothetical protein
MHAHLLRHLRLDLLLPEERLQTEKKLAELGHGRGGGELRLKVEV